MQNTTEKSSRSAEGLYKFFIYFVLVLLAVTIIVPVAWGFKASIKQNAEFYGNPWALPAGFYWPNFVIAWNGAKMGEYMLNSVIVTALALALLLVVALPAAYCLSRSHFKEKQVGLSDNLMNFDSFLKRGAKWLTAQELAMEGMQKMIKEFGL